MWNGAAWALSKGHIPIVVPPFSYSDIEGVIPKTQGMLINELPKLNSLKEKLEKDFGLQQLNLNSWERKRDVSVRWTHLMNSSYKP